MSNSQPVAPTDYVDVSNYSTINQAITAAISGGHSGVYIPADYSAIATSSINIPAGFSIVGADPDTSVVHFTSMTASSGFVAKNADGITFSNFSITADSSHPTIDWSNAATVQDSGLIKVDGGSHIAVENVTFTDAPGRGLYLNNVTDSQVTGNHTVGGGYTHISVSGSNNTVSGNDIDGGQWYGLELKGSDFVVADNHIERLTGSQSFGITFQGLSNSTIKDNLIENVEHYGMYADGTATHDDAVIGNTIQQTGIVDGVRVNEAGTGIEIRGGAHDLLIANNTLPDELGYGIAVAGNEFAASGLPNGADAPNIVISGNSITDAWDPGIVVSGASHVTIRENYVSSPHSMGISIGDEHDDKSLSTTHSDYAQIINNKLVDNWLEGIWATGISYATISGNEILDNNLTGAVLANHESAGITLISWPENAPSTYNWIVGNIIGSDTGHELAGIYFAPSQGDNTVSHNDLSENVVSGVLDLSGTATNIDTNNKTAVADSDLSGAPPLADAGAADAVAPGAAVDLDGSATHLLSGTDATISFHWTQIYGDAVTIEDANSVHAMFAAPDSSATELLGFRLTVWDANGSTTDDVYYAVDPSEHSSAVSSAPFNFASLPDDPVFLGSSGNDVIQDRIGGKEIFGGSGNDWIAVGRGADIVDGGLGTDTVTYKDSDAGVTVDLNNTGPQTSAGWANGDVLTHVESLVGSKYADVLIGDAGDNSLDGGAGNDILIGGAGADRLIGGTGADLMIGGTGDDVYYVDNAGDTVIEQANEGSDSIRSSVSIDHLADNVERLVLTATEALNGTGNNLDNLIYGNDAANVLSGGDGNDQLFGYGGQDVLIGGAGADRLEGGAGADTLIGGAGSDTFWFKKGDANGDVLSDFNTNGELDQHLTDRIFLQGYGPGATVSQGENDTWHVDYAGGQDTITVHGLVHASDFHLV